MNDFTKEELESISNCIEIYGHDCMMPGFIYDPLLLKVQSMIDNYCSCDDCIHYFINDHSVVDGKALRRCKDCGKTE
jgi:hypothetical protein